MSDHDTSERTQPGRGSTPGIEDQSLQAATGKPAQVPGTPDGPNADGFDRSAASQALRPEPGEGPGDPRLGAGEFDEGEAGERPA